MSLEESITDLYKTLLQRHPDVNGWYGYINLLKSGVHIDVIANMIKNSVEYKNCIVNKNLNLHNSLVYLIITDYSYPMGGGEAFMLETIKTAHDLGFECVWISFRSYISEEYIDDIITYKDNYIDHRMNPRISLDNIINFIIHVYKPNIVHTQGSANIRIPPEFLKRNVKCIVGYHFWDGLVSLGKNGNKNILNNEDNKLIINNNEQNINCHVYVVSEFMINVVKTLGSRKIDSIIYPIPNEEHFKIEHRSIINNKNILIMNIHELKGGNIIYDILKAITDIPFIVIAAEHGSEEFNEKIKLLSLQQTNIDYKEYTDVKQLYSNARLVLHPSHVDETFCRIAYESASNGIPILTTGKGYTRELLGDCGIYIEEDSIKWIQTIKDIYNNEEKINMLSGQLIREMKKYDSHKDDFKKLLTRIYSNKIGIYCPWGDQGLGIQCRFYADILIKNGFEVFIFSFLSYFSRGKSLCFQKNPEEWKNITYVYYSLNTRETVTENEIMEFITQNGVKTFIIPEICWGPIYERISWMKKYGCKVIAIPNIEIVIKSELPNYSMFDSILCNTHICLNILSKYNVHNLKYIGHSLEYKSISNKDPILNGIKFVHFAGVNGIVRKQTSKVFRAFINALKVVSNIQLYISISNEIPIELLTEKHEKIIVNMDRCSYEEVKEIYSKSHASIQVSSHEGLGIGFYESISHGTPVISLNTPPHNEVIKEGVSGWLLNCTYKPLIDNTDPVISGADFAVDNLTEKIIWIANHPENVETLISNSKLYYQNNFGLDKFEPRFLDSIK